MQGYEIVPDDRQILTFSHDWVSVHDIALYYEWKEARAIPIDKSDNVVVVSDPQDYESMGASAFQVGDNIPMCGHGIICTKTKVGLSNSHLSIQDISERIIWRNDLMFLGMDKNVKVSSLGTLTRGLAIGVAEIVEEPVFTTRFRYRAHIALADSDDHPEYPASQLFSHEPTAEFVDRCKEEAIRKLRAWRMLKGEDPSFSIHWKQTGPEFDSFRFWEYHGYIGNEKAIFILITDTATLFKR